VINNGKYIRTTGRFILTEDITVLRQKPVPLPQVLTQICMRSNPCPHSKPRQRCPNNIICIIMLIFVYFCFFGKTAPPQWARASSFKRFLDHNDAPHSVGLLWTSDQLVAETSTWQNTTITTDKHRCQLWDSKPQSQQASGRRPTP